MSAPLGNKYSSGRPKGSENKVTIQLKEAFKRLSDNNIGKVQGWLDRIAKDDPDKAMTLYLALTERVIGKMATNQIDITSKGEILKAPVLLLNGTTPTDSD